MEQLSMSVELPNGTVVNSFTEAAAGGFPFACELFATCDRPADVATSHPVLDAVPACRRCFDKMAALA